ncbi:MAG: hypothetical protein WC538_10340 [Thermoanaerobaculia bacterium]|jgi:hypothetical protein
MILQPRRTGRLAAYSVEGAIMRNPLFALLITLALQGCSSADRVEILNPLGGEPDKPSTVRAVVRSIDSNFGTLRVQTRTVDGAKRSVAAAVWIDEQTIFTNSGGGKNLRSWEEITGAEIVIKGWYRDDRYYADEIDVISFPPVLPDPKSPASPADRPKF